MAEKTNMDEVVNILVRNTELSDVLFNSTLLEISEGISDNVETIDDVNEALAAFNGNVKLTEPEVESAATALMATRTFQDAKNGVLTIGSNAARMLVRELGMVSHTTPGFTELVNAFSYQSDVEAFIDKYREDGTVVWDALAWAVVDAAVYGAIKPAVEDAERDLAAAASKNIGEPEAEAEPKAEEVPPVEETNSSEESVKSETTNLTVQKKESATDKIISMLQAAVHTGHPSKVIHGWLDSADGKKFLEAVVNSKKFPKLTIGTLATFGGEFSSKTHLRMAYSIAYVSTLDGTNVLHVGHKPTEDDYRRVTKAISMLAKVVALVLSNDDDAIVKYSNEFLDKVVKLAGKNDVAGLEAEAERFNAVFDAWLEPSLIRASKDDTFGVVSYAFESGVKGVKAA